MYLKGRLDESIKKGLDYNIIYQLSIELDELIAEYYQQHNNSKNSIKLQKNS